MPEYEIALIDAINVVRRMFEAEYSCYQKLWNDDAVKHRQEIRLRMLNEVLNQLEQMRKFKQEVC